MTEHTLYGGSLKQTILEVERDEAEALELLVNLLDKVRETSHTEPLNAVCNVLKEWQNRPPRVIVTELAKIGRQFEECLTPDNR